MQINPINTEDFLDQYSKSGRFSYGSPRNIKVGGLESDQIAFLRSQGPYDSKLCLWSLDLISGKESLLIDPNTLVNQANLTQEEKAKRERLRESSNGITSYTINATGEIICFELSGELYIYIVAEKTLKPLTQFTKIINIFNPQISPDGKKIVYSNKNNLCCLISTDMTWQRVESKNLFISEEETVSYGQAEFIAAEEMGRNSGAWWSPDSSQMIATKVDTSAVQTWWISNPADPQIEPRPTKYPAAGTPNAKVELYICDLSGNNQKIEWTNQGQTKFEYLANVIWNQDTKDPVVIRQTRNQKQVNIAKYNLSKEALEPIQEIVSNHWVELFSNSPFFYKGKVLTIQDTDSSRAIHIDSEPIQQNSYVRQIIGSIDDSVVFTASPIATETDLYTIDIRTKDVQRINTEPGVSSATISNKKLIVAHTCETKKQTTYTIYFHDKSANTFKQITDDSDNPVTIKNLTASSVMTSKPIFLKPSKNINTAIFIPESHNGEKLPILLDPYGGPHAQRVTKRYNTHLISQWFANQGFLVVVTDGRGTPGNNPNWEKAISGNLADPVLEDQIIALDFVGEKYPFADQNSVAIRGWSFGGYLAALAAIEKPDRIHAAIAGAPVTDWRLYDTHYTERYLGDPQKQIDAYNKSDLINKAHKLERPLMIIHGLADDNVFVANSLQLSNALVSAGKDHTLINLVNVSHMTPQENLSRNLLQIQLSFLSQHLN